MSDMKEFFRTTDIVAEGLKKGVKKGAEKGKKWGTIYVACLIAGILLMFIPFIIMTWIGIDTESQGLKMAGGIWRAVIGIGVAIIFSLIAIPVMYFLKGKQGIEIYGKTILTGVLVALCTSLLLMVVPLKSNPQSILPFIMCLIILGIIITATANIKMIVWTVVPIFAITLISFFVPNISDIGTKTSLPPIPIPKPVPPPVKPVPVPTEPGGLGTLTPITPGPRPEIAYAHEIAVMISNSPGDSELIAAALREKGKDAVSATSFSANLARYIIKGVKSVKFGHDRTFGDSDIIEAQVTFNIQVIDTQNGKVINTFQVMKKYSGLSRESAERTTTESAIESVNENYLKKNSASRKFPTGFYNF